jgi:hypothetical protein
MRHRLIGLVYGRYSQREWNSLSFEQRSEAAHSYWAEEMLKQWKAQYHLEKKMGIPGSQLQPYVRA